VKRHLTYLYCLLVIVSVVGTAYSAEPGASRYDTWIAAPPEAQIYNEAQDDQKGMGRIFVPAMTNAQNEPFYAVFQGDTLIGEKTMGSSFFLPAGKYSVILGTGTLEQRIRKEVEIGREQMVIITPDWSALTVDIIDQSRNNYKQDLQIFNLITGETFGIIPSINPDLGEQLPTLILKPGLYKIVKRGQDFNTFVNFTTVLLESGAYTPYTIVINSDTKDFTGAGILSSSLQKRTISHWQRYAAVHGSVIVNSSNDISSRTLRTDLTLLGQFENRMLYDNFPHYYNSTNLVELGAQQQSGAKFGLTQNRIQLKNTYVYYILGWLGGYGRLDVTSHPMPTTYLFSTNTNVTLLDQNGDTTSIKHNVSQFETQPALFPLGFKEGVGINVTPLKRFNARLSFRTGFGLQQDFRNNVYQAISGDTVYQKQKNSYVRGLETSVVSNLIFFSNLGMTTELDVLFPFGGEERRIDIENYITLGISKYVTIEHTFRFSHDRSSSPWDIQEQFVSVRISYYIF
jgi:hypothetical protein